MNLELLIAWWEVLAYSSRLHILTRIECDTASQQLI